MKGSVFMPPPRSDFEYKKVEPPKGLKDFPRFLRELLGGFFGRMIYIVKLVWETGPWIMIVMSLIALFQGIIPIISSYISRYLRQKHKFRLFCAFNHNFYR